MATKKKLVDSKTGEFDLSTMTGRTISQDVWLLTYSDDDGHEVILGGEAMVHAPLYEAQKKKSVNHVESKTNFFKRFLSSRKKSKQNDQPKQSKTL